MKETVLILVYLALLYAGLIFFGGIMKTKIFSVRKICIMAILSALSALVMLVEFPLWFAPPFYKFDFSEFFVLIGGFALGPVEAVIIEFLKVLINTLFNGTDTAFVGEIANFIVGCFFVLPSSIIYKYKKTKQGAVIGLFVCILSFTIIGAIINYFVLLPLYSNLYQLPLEALIGMGTEKNGRINSLFTFVIFATVPFNVFKGVVDSALTLLIYKKVSPILHKNLDS